METRFYETNSWNNPIIVPETKDVSNPNMNSLPYVEHNPWNLPVRHQLFGYIFPSNQWRALA
jgi:hypothetical protein